MEQLRENYEFDLAKPIGTPYQDAQIKNHSYKAKRRSDDILVQLVIYQSSKSGQIHSYHKKISKAMELQHSNLVPILDCIKNMQTNQLYIVLQWNEGYCLKECLKQQILSQGVALNLIKGVLGGLKQLNKAGIQHSFVNIQNIELYQGTGRLSFRNLIYKTYYLAPQIKENHQKSFEADLFSLGVCLYRLVFGTLPFKQKTQEQYIKTVKIGVSRKQAISNSNFPRMISEQLQSLINKMCHLQPSERLASIDKFQKMVDKETAQLHKLIGIFQQTEYRLLSIQQQSKQLTKVSVINFKSKEIYHADIIKNNITEISGFIDQTINPFKKNANSNFANIRQFIVLSKDSKTFSIAIIYSYCAQGSLKAYRAFTKFNEEMIGEVQNFLTNVFLHWKGQYKFLTNDQILIKKGKLLLKYPPFPDSDVKQLMEKAKNGTHFYAPELSSGVQSQSADSWSVGVMQYWMRCDSMPSFEQGQLYIKNQANLSPEQIKSFQEVIGLKVSERKNLFPIQRKTIPKIDDSYDDLSSGIAETSRQKLRPNQASNKHLQIREFDGGKQDIQEYAFDKGRQNGQTEKNKKGSGKGIKRQSRANSPSKTEEVSPKFTKFQQSMAYQRKVDQSPQFSDELSQNQNKAPQKVIFDLSDEDSPHKMSQRQRGDRKKLRSPNKQNSLSTNQNPQTAMTQSLHKMLPKDEEALQLQNQVKLKRKNRFSQPSKLQQQRFGRDDRRKKGKAQSVQQNIKDKEIKKEETGKITPEDPEHSDQILDNLRKEGAKIAIVEKHWSKPFRIVVKCIIAILIYLFVFYFNFLKISGQLLKNRYEYTTQELFLKNNQLSVVATINFTLVTTTPSAAYYQLNNQTLSYVRDTIMCTTNTYWVNSNILSIIQSSGFGTYQAIGIVFVIFNLIMICVVLSKLDFPKALQYCQFDDNIYVPLYSWIIANLGIASLTSMTFLLYGGLFQLQLEPCISWTAFPSLMYIFKQMISSFVWRFIWIYLGVVLDYVLIFYVIIKPKVRLHNYLYGLLIILYIASLGARALGSYDSSKESILGACGELLLVLVGLLLFVIDLIISCKLRKLSKQSQQQVLREEANNTEIDFMFSK